MPTLPPNHYSQKQPQTWQVFGLLVHLVHKIREIYHTKTEKETLASLSFR